MDLSRVTTIINATMGQTQDKLAKAKEAAKKNIEKLLSFVENLTKKNPKEYYPVDVLIEVSELDEKNHHKPWHYETCSKDQQ